MTDILESMRRIFVPIHKEGYPFILIALFATIVLAWLWSPLGWIGTILTVWVCYFFRDPPRVTPIREGLVVSPADGRVNLITTAVPPAAFYTISAHRAEKWIRFSAPDDALIKEDEHRIPRRIRCSRRDNSNPQAAIEVCGPAERTSEST